MRLRDTAEVEIACGNVFCDGPRRDARSVCFGAVFPTRGAGAKQSRSEYNARFDVQVEEGLAMQFCGAVWVLCSGSEG